jgi:hypothetical protein
MDYIRQSLAEDEELVHVGHFHWLYTVGAVFNIVFGVILAIVIIAVAIAMEPMLPAFLRFDVPYDASLLDKVRAVHPGVKILAFLVMVMGCSGMPR